MLHYPKSEETKAMSKIRTLKMESKDIVAQNNSLIESPKNLNLMEYKLFMSLVAKINPNDSHLPIFKVTVEEFAKMLGVKTTSYIYRDLQKAADRLLTRYATVYYPEKNKTVKTNLTQQVEYLHGEGCIVIKLSPAIKPFLCDLRREFTQYKLSNIIHLSSVYGIRLYELLKSHEILQKRIFSIDELRYKLGLQKQQYTRFSDFRRFVLDTALREINLKTDIQITFGLKKTRQKITAIKFDIIPKSTKTSTPKETLASVKQVMNMGYSLIESLDISNKTEDETFIDAVEAVTEQIEKGNSRHPKAMLQTAIEENWKPSKKKFHQKQLSEKEKSKTVTKKTHISKLLRLFHSKS